MDKEIYAGKEVVLEKAILYPRFCSTSSTIVKSGTYYLWDDIIKDNKIRITKTKEGIGKLGFIIGWIDIKALFNTDDFKIGDCVLVNGILNTYADGTGNQIVKEDSIMYIVDMLDPEQFINCFGLASAINRNRIGWAPESIIKKYN